MTLAYDDTAPAARFVCSTSRLRPYSPSALTHMSKRDAARLKRGDNRKKLRKAHAIAQVRQACAALGHRGVMQR